MSESVYGVRYGQNGEDDVNKSTNMAVGILNVINSYVISIVTIITMYIAMKLKKSQISKLSVNSGPFATNVSYSQI